MRMRSLCLAAVLALLMVSVDGTTLASQALHFLTSSWPSVVRRSRGLIGLVSSWLNRKQSLNACAKTRASCPSICSRKIAFSLDTALDQLLSAQRERRQWPCRLTVLHQMAMVLPLLKHRITVVEQQITQVQAKALKAVVFAWPNSTLHSSWRELLSVWPLLVVQQLLLPCSIQTTSLMWVILATVASCTIANGSVVQKSLAQRISMINRLSSRSLAIRCYLLALKLRLTALTFHIRCPSSPTSLRLKCWDKRAKFQRS